MAGRNFKSIRVESVGAALRIVLSNPARKNAIGPRMVSELLYALEDANSDESIRAIVITGDGDAFCAGGDFSQMVGGDPDDLPIKGDYSALMLALVRCPKPLIARVVGPALGGGVGLVAACHFAIAADNAKLGTPEVNVGLFPMMIMAVLGRVMPPRRLLSMMLLGERIGAEEAARVGLVSSVVPVAEIDRAVEALVHSLAEKSPIALRMGLTAWADQRDLALQDALPMLRDRLGEILATDDAREGLSAFLEKRPPKWTGR